MKKFIVIFALMLITFVSKAQYINPNIRQDNTTPAQWNEWKGLMSQYNKGKGLIYGGLAVGAVGVTTFAILRNTNRNQMESGSDIVNIGDGAATINVKVLILPILLVCILLVSVQLAQLFGVLYEKTMQGIGLIGSILTMGLLIHFNKGGEL